MRTNILILVATALSLFFVGAGVSNLLKINFTQELDTMANKTVLVYNIKREQFDYTWENGVGTIHIGDQLVNVYINPDILTTNSGINIVDTTLVLKETCSTIQIKIDLELAKINNNLVSGFFDDNFKPLNIIKEFKCI